jgi:ATP-dependent DNA helicase Q1
MVFTEQTGLSNLYSMIKYCINITECKRNLIAEHFHDTRWHLDGNCNQMCEICKGDKPTIKVNCIREANFVLGVLEKHTAKSKDNRITANKLAETAVSELGKSKDMINLNQIEIERLILKMLMEQYLREDFHFTPYNTICYLVKANSLANRNSFEIDILKRNLINNNNTSNHKSGAKAEQKKTETQILNKKPAKRSVDEVKIDSDESNDIIQLDFGSDDENGPMNKKTKN